MKKEELEYVFHLMMEQVETAKPDVPSLIKRFMKTWDELQEEAQRLQVEKDSAFNDNTTADCIVLLMLKKCQMELNNLEEKLLQKPLVKGSKEVDLAKFHFSFWTKIPYEARDINRIAWLLSDKEELFKHDSMDFSMAMKFFNLGRHAYQDVCYHTQLPDRKPKILSNDDVVQSIIHIKEALENNNDDANEYANDSSTIGTMIL